MDGHALSTATYVALALARAQVPERVVLIGNSRSGVRVRLTRPHRAFRGTRLMTAVHARVGGEAATLYLPERVFSDILGSLSDVAVGMAFDEPTAALLFEAALADLLDTFERTFGVTVEITGVDAAHANYDDNINLSYRIETGPGAIQFGHAALPDPLARQVVQHWCARDLAAAATFDPEVTLEMRIGSTAMTATELNALSEGDVMLFDRSPIAAKKALLVVSQACGTLVDIDEGSAVVNKPFVSLRDPAVATYSTQRLGAPPKTVIATLTRARVPLSQIERLTLGERFDLPAGITGPVDLHVDERPIAEGRLVRTTGALGVRIVRITRKAANG